MPELKCPEAKNGFYAESFVTPSDLSNFNERSVGHHPCDGDHLSTKSVNPLQKLGVGFLTKSFLHQNEAIANLIKKLKMLINQQIQNKTK